MGKGGEEAGKWRMTADGYRAPHHSDENALKVTALMAAQHGEYTKTTEFYPVMGELFSCDYLSQQTKLTVINTL